MAKKKSVRKRPGEAKLASYIKKALKKGYGQEKVYDELQAIHWPRYVIEAAWKDAMVEIRKAQQAKRKRQRALKAKEAARRREERKQRERKEAARQAAKRRKEAERKKQQAKKARKKRERALKARQPKKREAARKRRKAAQIKKQQTKEAKQQAERKKAKKEAERKRAEARKMQAKKEAARKKAERRQKIAAQRKKQAVKKAVAIKEADRKAKIKKSGKERLKKAAEARLIKKVFPHLKRRKRKLDEFIRTGLEGFDALFDKGYGIPKGTSILIEGGPGSGKTLFCLATVVGMCKQGQKCLYMSFEEPEERLMGHMRRFNWPAEQLIKKDMLRIKRFEAIDVSRSVEALLSAAKKELLIEVDPVLFPADYKPDFVVIDSLTSIASAFSGHESRFRIYMEQLFRYLERNRITTFLIREVATPTHVGTAFQEVGAAVSFLADGIIVLYNVIYRDGKRDFAMEILKVRGSSFKRRIVEMDIIKGKGLKIHPEKVLKRGKRKGFRLT